MKTPWGYSKKIEQLEDKIEQLEEELEASKNEKEKFQERFEAEKERRSDLSRKKQEAEEKLNKLQQKLENRPQKNDKQEEKREDRNRDIELGFEEVMRGLEKTSTVNSDEEDLLTVYSGKNSLDDLKALKNSVSQEVFTEIQKDGSSVVFTDEKFFRWKIRTRPFLESFWSLGKNFRPGKILDFVEKEKYWVLASMGETEIFREASGSFEKVDRVKTRVNRKQKKGGFSQGRFERKREEQISGHVKKVNEALKEISGEIFVLGDKRLCEDIDAEYLGGFDSSRPVSADVFYNFKFIRF
ncbi:Vms1/Ankzf1 family peptidyl-tRNA hydrolase [Candidatus Nanosalina sp. VS9-1]|uniref:Vms1/Ankzf1 family peptidyl-tRNA hydrolase n=1 Tax=Candidatus Nanosalina sp. VS9-1 TaxID=3388566 RepID=UPI0039E030D3